MTRPIDMLRQALLKNASLDDTGNFSQRGLFRALMMLICDADEIVRQHACWNLGEIISGMESEKIDNLVRRLLWRLNPESGDHPIGLPELLGEIGHRAPAEIESFVSVILYYIDDEKLLPGLLQAAGRIGQKLPDVLSEYIDEISMFLQHEDMIVSGNAALALHRIGATKAKAALETLKSDAREIVLFYSGEFRKTNLAEFAREALECEPGPCFVSTGTTTLNHLDTC